MNGRFRKRGERAEPAPHPALGAFFSGPRPRGAYAAVSRPGRKVGAGFTPALHGLFHAGHPVGISQIGAMATNILRGQGN